MYLKKGVKKLSIKHFMAIASASKYNCAVVIANVAAAAAAAPAVTAAAVQQQ